MQTLSLAVAAILILIAAIMWVLDMVGRAETIQKRWPRVWNVTTSRPLILLLLVVSLFLLDRDFKDTMAIPPPPQVKILAPPAPIIQLQVVAAPKESPYSLRRRTFSLAKELYSWTANRAAHQPPVAVPNSNEPNPTEERKREIKLYQDYARETENQYKERYRERLVGIVKEYEAKGVPVHWLASSFQQRPPSIAFLGSGMEGSPMDELYQFRELAYHVDARDHLITIY